MQLTIKYFTSPQAYHPIWQQMRDFTLRRQNNRSSADSLWLLEHQPVFTLGQAGDEKHILNHNDIPVVRCDRGGQVTYHGPGQLMIYTLLDLQRLQLNTRSFVRKLEQWIINYLASHQLEANNDPNAPGVYIDGKKICSIGLRVTKGLSYHGLAFNIDMDLTPFDDINPCGFEQLTMTHLAQYISCSKRAIIEGLISTFVTLFEYDNWHYQEKNNEQ